MSATCARAVRREIVGDLPERRLVAVDEDDLCALGREAACGGLADVVRRVMGIHRPDPRPLVLRLVPVDRPAIQEQRHQGA
jgi:hypothetical protein